VVINNAHVVTMNSTTLLQSLTIEAGGSLFHNGSLSLATDLNVTGLCSNNGLISISGNLTNDGSISGTGGYFCVDDTTTNNGGISGTIDFCDLTPPLNSPYIDFNSGSIDTTVTYCQVGPCATIGIQRNLLMQEEIIVFASSLNNTITIEIKNTKVKEFSFQLFDLHGRLIGEHYDLPSAQARIYQDNISSGLYLYRLFTDSRIIGQGKLLIE